MRYGARYIVAVFFLVVCVESGSSQTRTAPAQDPGRAERVMKALSTAYPEAIGAAVYTNGDWAVPVRGKLFYYADGRLLPEELRKSAAEYDPAPFYCSYPAELPEWKAPDPERTRQLRASPPRSAAKRSSQFWDQLWDAHNEREARSRLLNIRFLGRNAVFHGMAADKLKLVEARIQEEAKTSAEIARWIKSLDVMSVWYWRNVSQTQSRSFHAYGVAIDLLPASYKGETYWQWTAAKKIEFWAVPYERRVHPPQAVIKAFEM
ncbi:MAG: M15 family peptidase [Treponema sp.]|nr:M15 family peptidase [Treponema sp.]